MITITKPESVKLKFENSNELVALVKALERMNFPSFNLSEDRRKLLERIAASSWETAIYKLIQKASFPNPGRNQITFSIAEGTALVLMLARLETNDPYTNNIAKMKLQEVDRLLV